MADLAVIMSVYNKDRLKFLRESVQSILDQTYTDFHFYIIFDGPVSFDVEAYIDSLADERLKIYKKEIHEGLASALNYLLKIILKSADYKLIARMDADDISFSTRFEKQRNYFFVNDGISCLGTWFQEIDESGKLLISHKLPVRHNDLRKFFFKRSPFAHPSVMFRKEMVEIIGLYPTHTLRMEDYVYWGYAIKYGFIFGNIPECLLYLRKDKDYYKRRSGLRFGINYIKTRFSVNKMLNAPFQFYILSLLTGLIRLFPSCFLRRIYNIILR